MEPGRAFVDNMAATKQARSEPESDQIDEFFKTILASKSLRIDEKKELELIAKLSSEHRAGLEEARSAAAQQARKFYKCVVCGLEFLGILSFQEHNEETSHMKNQQRGW